MLHFKESLLKQFQKFLFVAAGAIPGALIRWSLDNDLLVNLIGAFILGLVIGFDFRSPLKLLIAFGFCGALTTFSSWILSVFQLLVKGDFLYAFSLMIFPVITGIFAVGFGFWIGSRSKFMRLN